MEDSRERPPATQVLHAVSTTWARDSHDLFDYEARHVDTKTFRVTGPVQFTRSGTEVTAHTDISRVPINGQDYLLRVQQRENGGYTVYPAERNGSHPGPRKLWLVVRDLQTRGHFLQEGDIFKLGRFKLRVRQMVPSTGPNAGFVQPELQLDETEARTAGIGRADQNRADVTAEAEDLSTIPCRICLLEGPSDDDPLISSCSCNGSIRYVHLGCLRHWIKGRLNLPDSSSNGTYFYKQLTCELCHAPYPAYVHVNGERVPLVPVPRTQPPFIVLENLVRESQQHNNRGLHVISLAEKKLLKLGRGHESDVRIADVSISRCHATIRYSTSANGGNFILEDHSSKFGTLVVIKKPKQMDVGSAMSVQVGRTVLQMSVLQNEADGGVEALTGQLRETSLA
jgi:hypothetical protein